MTWLEIVAAFFFQCREVSTVSMWVYNFLAEIGRQVHSHLLVIQMHSQFSAEALHDHFGLRVHVWSSWPSGRHSLHVSVECPCRDWPSGQGASVRSPNICGFFWLKSALAWLCWIMVLEVWPSSDGAAVCSPNHSLCVVASSLLWYGYVESWCLRFGRQVIVLQSALPIIGFVCCVVFGELDTIVSFFWWLDIAWSFPRWPMFAN